jgi:hypothetical protein
MNRQHRRFSFVPLAKRFALPALAAWLLHAGIWTLIFVLCQTIMAVLSNSVNWFLDEFFAGNGAIVETSWRLRFIAPEAGEGLILGSLGIIIGAWVIYRKKESGKTIQPPPE